MFYFHIICFVCLLSVYDAHSKYLNKYSMNKPGEAQVLDPQIDANNKINFQDLNRVKRYGVWHSGWSKRNITYKVLNQPRTFWPKKTPLQLSEHINEMVTKAFAEYAQYCGLHFHKLSNYSKEKADISISFQQGMHEDNSPFDGPDNLLAHTSMMGSLRSMRAVIHFDDDETWVDVGSRHPFPIFAEFYPTVLHELGHVLGLDDSSDRHTIMTQYRSLDSPVTLQEDDVLGIQYVYGKRPLNVRSRLSTPKPNNRRPAGRRHYELGRRRRI